ncbi:MAG: hypothetical protein ABFD46_12245 [Armatimonadota bacterium]
MFEFEMKRTPTVTDGLVIRWRCGNSFEISASRNGVSICGTFPSKINSSAGVDAIANQLRTAYSAHLEIKLTGDYKD